MNSTAQTLHAIAHYANQYGIHTGDQFADSTQMFRFDICALAYILAETSAWPPVFFTDEAASIALIESSAPAMAAIRAISNSLDSEPCETEIAPGMTVPDYIEHVSNWAATPPIGEEFPPTTAEVIGRILRAAETQKPDTYCTGDRCADCTPDEECCEATCGCCPRVDEHDHCRLAPGSEEDSKYCDQHGEGWLFDRSPKAERKYELLRRA